MIVFPRCLNALAAGASSSRSFLQSPWHSDVRFHLPCDFLCVWLETFSASFLSLSHVLKKSLVLQNSFHWSLELQLEMK